jgi:hypothetical protein
MGVTKERVVHCSIRNLEDRNDAKASESRGRYVRVMPSTQCRRGGRERYMHVLCYADPRRKLMAPLHVACRQITRSRRDAQGRIGPAPARLDKCLLIHIRFAY